MLPSVVGLLQTNYLRNIPVDAIRKKITLTFLFFGLPSVFLITGGMLLTTFGSVPLGIVALIAGFAMFILYSIRAGKINTQAAGSEAIF
jgi:hypothetical protein